MSVLCFETLRNPVHRTAFPPFFWLWFVCSLPWKTDVEMSLWLLLPEQKGSSISKASSLSVAPSTDCCVQW